MNKRVTVIENRLIRPVSSFLKKVLPPRVCRILNKPYTWIYNFCRRLNRSVTMMRSEGLSGYMRRVLPGFVRKYARHVILLCLFPLRWFELKIFLKVDNVRARSYRAPHTRELKIVHHIGGLGPGGAERQLVNLSLELHRKGFDIEILTTLPLVGESAHYSSYLQHTDIPVRMSELRDKTHITAQMKSTHWTNRRCADIIPVYLAPQVFGLADELLRINPDVLHCWLDFNSVIGGLAGLVAGVPRILLCGRNVNPSHFHWMYQPWFSEWYDFLVKSKRVILLNNSKAGAEDYARWLGIPASRFHIVYNGLDFDSFHGILETDTAEFRHSLDIPDKAFLIGGGFRLSSEKRPLDFLEVIRRVKKRIPDIRAVVAGIGPEEPRIRALIKENGLEDTILLLGRRDDLYTIMKACSVILLTSAHEGTPNVLLEAQYLGIPVVATLAGGTPEAVKHTVTGMLHPVGDVQGMADSVISLISDKTLAERMGAEGKLFMQQNFSLKKMTKDYMDIYYNNSLS